jgi:hypothetical protein
MRPRRSPHRTQSLRPRRGPSRRPPWPAPCWAPPPPARKRWRATRRPRRGMGAARRGRRDGQTRMAMTRRAATVQTDLTARRAARRRSGRGGGAHARPGEGSGPARTHTAAPRAVHEHAAAGWAMLPPASRTPLSTNGLHALHWPSRKIAPNEKSVRCQPVRCLVAHTHSVSAPPPRRPQAAPAVRVPV